jgi:methyl-accepting chemotaxis protein
MDELVRGRGIEEFTKGDDLRMAFQWNIQKKLLAAFSVLLVLVIIAGVVTLVASLRMERQSDLISRATAINGDFVEGLSVRASQIYHDFIEAGLMNNAVVLADGRKSAEEFRTLLATLPTVCSSCHENKVKGFDVEGSVTSIRKAFDHYYLVGEQMSNAFKEQQQYEGVVLIGEFHNARMSLDKQLARVKELGDRHFRDSLENVAVLTSTTRSTAFLGMGLVVVLGIALAFYISNRARVVIENVAGTADRVAGGDLTGADLDSSSDDEIGSLVHSVNQMKHALGEMLGSIVTTSNQVATSSEQLSATVKTITESMKAQANRADQVATSTTEMSQSVLDIAQNASNIAASSDETRAVASEGEAVVKRTVDEVQEISRAVTDSAKLMESLGARSNQIGEIINVINEIADQTNLLALNAAIEAARAGEQGRGFAVVADEVRKLAERTGRATTEISTMISAIQDETSRAVSSMHESIKRVEHGTELSSQAGQALHRIVDSVNALQTMVAHIASATEEMSTTSETISSDIETMAMSARQTGSSAAEITQAVDALARLSTELSGITKRFRTGKD